jgi:hypothetical protein
VEEVVDLLLTDLLPVHPPAVVGHDELGADDEDQAAVQPLVEVAEEVQPEVAEIVEEAVDLLLTDLPRHLAA